jgi:hypothetical protein
VTADHERIFLQADKDPYEGRTWAEDQIEENDTPYIRLDLYEELEARIAEADVKLAHTGWLGATDVRRILRGEGE